MLGCRRRRIYSMELVITFTRQIHIANQAPNDFVLVLLFPFERLLLRDVEFISPGIITILTRMFLQCMHPCMPLSVQSF
jgi:hypothetical protein